MKKYLISTLTVAAAMAVPAFSAELVASWDFSTATAIEVSSGTYTIAATSGDTNIKITTGSILNTTTGQLNVTSSGDVSHETTIDVSSANITTEEGISIVMTIEGFSSGSNNNNIFASIATNNNADAAAWGESGSGSPRSGLFMANGSSTYGAVTGSLTLSYPMTITMTLVGDTMAMYKDGDLIATVELSSSTYDLIAGTVTGIGIGSWDDGSSVGNEPGLNISSLYIYKGDVMAAPEPSMFGLMFGLGTIGLVATRRRKRA